jgi:hypothetical protein
MSAARRAEAAALFLRDLVFIVLLIVGGVWMLLTWLEPCAAATLCSTVPLVRAPSRSRAPRWWQRLRLQLRLRLLISRDATADQDVAFLRRELTLIRNLLDQVEVERAEIEDEIAWARSDLAKLQ